MNNKAIADDWRVAMLLPVFWFIDFLLAQERLAGSIFDRVRTRWVPSVLRSSGGFNVSRNLPGFLERNKARIGNDYEKHSLEGEKKTSHQGRSFGSTVSNSFEVSGFESRSRPHSLNAYCGQRPSRDVGCCEEPRGGCLIPSALLTPFFILVFAAKTSRPCCGQCT